MMASDMVDDHEMREAKRDYIDFLDDDVSWFLTRLCPCGPNKSIDAFNYFYLNVVGS